MDQDSEFRWNFIEKDLRRAKHEAQRKEQRRIECKKILDMEQRKSQDSDKTLKQHLSKDILPEVPQQENKSSKSILKKHGTQSSKEMSGESDSLITTDTDESLNTNDAARKLISGSDAAIPKASTSPKPKMAGVRPKVAKVESASLTPEKSDINSDKMHRSDSSDEDNAATSKASASKDDACLKKVKSSRKVSQCVSVDENNSVTSELSTDENIDAEKIVVLYKTPQASENTKRDLFSNQPSVVRQPGKIYKFSYAKPRKTRRHETDIDNV